MLHILNVINYRLIQNGLIFETRNKSHLIVVLVLTFVIATSSVIGAGYAKKASSNIFEESEAVQASDANQNIIERIANLQKQINELRRQIATLPPGPPGPPGPPSFVYGELIQQT